LGIGVHLFPLPLKSGHAPAAPPAHTPPGTRPNAGIVSGLVIGMILMSMVFAIFGCVKGGYQAGRPNWAAEMVRAESER